MPDYNIQLVHYLLKFENPLVLDIRSEKEYQQAHLCGATLIPTTPPPLNQCQKNDLALKLQYITKESKKSRPVIVYCKKGVRGNLARNILLKHGFENVTLLGGVDVEPLNRLMQTYPNRSCVPPVIDWKRINYNITYW